MKNRKTFSVCLLFFLFLAGCQSVKEENKVIPQEAAVSNFAAPKQYGKGDQVPNEMVCMVTNKFMGEEQIKVPFNGKMFRGCCEGCVEKIKTDETVRTAVDPGLVKWLRKQKPLSCW